MARLHRRLTAAVLSAALLFGGAAAALAKAAAAPASSAARLDRLEAEVIAAEDLSAINRLQRAYGYYADKGLWEDLAELFADDAVGYYPDGVYVGRPSLRLLFLQNLGSGKLGIGDGRMYNHMVLQPVVHLDPGGRTAKGRWRVIAQLGRLGGTASWAGGVYENSYVKQGGVWKIATLRYLPAYSAPYEGGWAKAMPPRPPAAASTPAAPVHAPDRTDAAPCPGFPTACPGAFHYANVATPAGAPVWIASTLPKPPPSKLTGGARLASLDARVERLKDEQAIEDLQRIYGYYIDRGRWDQAADLFTADGTIEVGQAEIYVGPRRIQQYLALTGPLGLREGLLNDHMQLQPIVVVAPDGRTARGYNREWSMLGDLGKWQRWEEATHDNVYVKAGGVWRIKAMHVYSNAAYDYDLGWGKDARPAPGPSATLPPDRGPTVVYASYPKQEIAPFPFDNPVTGKAPRYPSDAVVGRLDPAPKPAPRAGPAASFAQVQARLDRVKDHHELENLQSAYGYYVDKGYWDDIIALMGRDSTYELAQRGVYVGFPSVSNFLRKVFGTTQGPQPNRLGEHMSLQPVITVAPDGKTAQIRVRLIQMLGGIGGTAVWGAGVYENAAVKEDGVWKFSKVHVYNTWSAAYDDGWSKKPSRPIPGASATTPPDRPPSEAIKGYPVIYPIPYHYKNPVTGR